MVFLIQSLVRSKIWAVALVVAITQLYPVNCRDLSQKHFKNRCSKSPYKDQTSYECNRLWDSFKTDLACTNDAACNPPTDISTSSSNFISLLPPKLAENKTLFYSGWKMNDAAYEIGKTCIDKSTVMATHLYYIFEEDKFCCVKQNGDICMTNGCKTYGIFWDEASSVLAQSTYQHTAVVLDASSSTPYDRSKTFARVEIKQLSPSKVTSLTVIFAYRTIKKKKYSCSNPGNVLDMVREDAGGIKVLCEDQDALGCGWKWWYFFFVLLGVIVLVGCACFGYKKYKD